MIIKQSATVSLHCYLGLHRSLHIATATKGWTHTQIYRVGVFYQCGDQADKVHEITTFLLVT